MSMLPPIVGTISVNADGVEQGVGQANASLAQLEHAVTTNWWGLKNLGMAFAALPAAVTAGLGVAVKAASDWDTAMVGVQRTSNATESEMHGIEDRLLAVARITPIATKELAALAEQGGALGIPNEALGEFARIMGTLIASTDITEANVADLARVMNVMNVPVDQYENFASTLIDVGRNTAATEKEIATMSRRLSGAAATAGLTTAEVLGISAAVLSLGPRAEAGSTAVSKTITDMARSIREGGDEVKIFARVAGLSVDEFTQKFRDEPAKAFAAFVTGLGHMSGGIEQTTAILDALGIKEVRQAQALQQLAAGTRNAGSEQSDINAILDAANRSWSDNTTLTDVAARRTKTLAAQLQILRNILFEAANAIGQSVLPLLAPFIGFLQNLLVGFIALPGPVKAILGLFIGMATVISAVGAAAFLLLPRLLLISNSIRGLIAGQAEAAMTAQAAANGMNAEAVAAAAAAQGLSEEAVMAAFAASNTEKQAIAALASAKANQVLATSMGIVSKIGKFAIPVIAGLAIGLSLFGSKAGKVPKVNTDIGKTAGAAIPNVDDLGDAIDTEGNKAKDAADKIGKLAQAHIDYASALRQQESAQSRLSDARDQVTAAQEALADLPNKIAEAEDRLTEARQGAKDAADRLKDAEENLSTAREDGLAALSDAEDAVGDANSRYQDSLEQITQAEEKLADLRSDTKWAEKVAEVERKIADARNKVYSATQDAQDAEWHLNYLRGEGASARDIADAEHTAQVARENVANANADLAKSEADLATVSPEERAKQIAKAEQDVLDTRRESEKALRDVGKAEKDLAKIRENVANDKYFLDAQKQYEQAQRDVDSSLRAVQKAEKDVAEVRSGKAEMKALKDAQNGYKDALYNVAEANVEVRKQTALMAGQNWDAADSAHALAEELGKVDPKGFADQIKALASAPNIPDVLDDLFGGAAGSAGGGMQDYFDALNKQISEGVSDAIGNVDVSGGAKQSFLDKMLMPLALILPAALPLLKSIGTKIFGSLFGGTVAAEGAGVVSTGLLATIGEGLATAAAAVGAVIASPAFLIGAAITAVIVGVLWKTGLGKKLLDWVGGAVSWVSKKVGPTISSLGHAISDVFHHNLDEKLSASQKNIQKSADNIVEILVNASAQSKKLTEKNLSDASKSINDIVDAAVQGAGKKRDEITKLLSDLNKNSKFFTDDMANKGIDDANRDYTESTTAIKQKKDAIVARLTELKNQGVPITTEMVNGMLAQLYNLRDQSIASVEESATRQEALIRSLQLSTVALTGSQAKQIIKNSEDQRDKTIDAAKKQYDDTIYQAERGYEIGALTRDQADEIIRQAGRQRDEAIAAAKAAHEKVKTEVEGLKTDTVRLSRETADQSIAEWNRLYGSLADGSYTAHQVVKGNITDLYNDLVHHSIIPDMVNESLKWFAKLPDQVPGLFEDMSSKALQEANKLSKLSLPSLKAFGLDYLAGPDGFGINTPTPETAAASAGSVRYGDTFNLTAITNADPDDIVNQFMFANRVRTRG
jgi:TP901 family phage tail tape measure protein